MEIIGILILIIALTLINSFFASAEMAIVSANTNKLSKEFENGNKNALLLKKLTDEPTHFLSTIQVAITLAGFISSSFAGSNLSVHVVDLFSLLNLSISAAVAQIIVTLLLSFFSLVFGELFPKKLALKNPEKVAMRSAKVVYIVMIIFKPFVKLLSASTNLLLKITGNDKQTDDEKVSEDEIRSLIITGHIAGVINEGERQMIESVFNFNDLTADAVMTPRTDVYAININKPLYDYLDEIIDEGFSRIPVFENDIDNIVGMLHIKDLFKYAKDNGFKDIPVKSILRKAYFVPKHMKIDVLFKNMQETNNQIAILIDEYGGSAGIVTIEDLVEEIVGNIYDEYDEEDKTIQTIENNTYLVDGAIQIQELNKRLKLNIDDSNEEFDTLGGLIVYILGYIPKAEYNKDILYEDLVFKIHKVKSNRIEEVLVTLPNKEEATLEENV